MKYLTCLAVFFAIAFNANASDVTGAPADDKATVPATTAASAAPSTVATDAKETEASKTATTNDNAQNSGKPKKEGKCTIL